MCLRKWSERPIAMMSMVAVISVPSWHISAGSADLSCKSAYHPNDPHNAGQECIGPDLPVRHISRNVQPKAAIDHAQGYDDSSEPDVQVRGKSASAFVLEADVVQGAEDGLEKENEEKKNAENRMIVLILFAA
jgi:hypothetical protein